jgi:Ca2+-binding EF-hand superfamily protein
MRGDAVHFEEPHPMPVPLLLLLAAAAPPATNAITVTGHAWAPFISPMGEPFRARAADEDTLARWFNEADRNHDGQLTIDEMQADADRFFATLDGNHDGEIDPDEISAYEWDVAPDIQVMSRTRPAPGPSKASTEPRREWRLQGTEVGAHGVSYPGGLQGAARYALLNIPEPVAAADTDFNRGVSLAEFRQAAIARFQLLDSARSGRLNLAHLETLRPSPDRNRKAEKDALDARIGNPLPAKN